MKSISRILLCIFALLLSSNAYALECIATSAQICTDGSCGAGANVVRIYIDQKAKAVSRCDTKGCDKFDVDHATSGVMESYGSVARGYLLKINTVDGSFVEVATQVTIVALKFGVCKQ